MHRCSGNARPKKRRTLQITDDRVKLVKLSACKLAFQYTGFTSIIRLTGVDKGDPGGPAPPNGRAKKNFFVKIEGL